MNASLLVGSTKKTCVCNIIWAQESDKMVYQQNLKQKLADLNNKTNAASFNPRYFLEACKIGKNTRPNPLTRHTFTAFSDKRSSTLAVCFSALTVCFLECYGFDSRSFARRGKKRRPSQQPLQVRVIFSWLWRNCCWGTIREIYYSIGHQENKINLFCFLVLSNQVDFSFFEEKPRGELLLQGSWVQGLEWGHKSPSF